MVWLDLQRRPKMLRDDELLASSHQTPVSYLPHFKNDVLDIGAKGDGAIARQGPGRRRPDDDAGILQRGHRRLDDRKARPYRRRGVVVVLDLGLGERGLLDDRPHDRLGALVEA